MTNEELENEINKLKKENVNLKTKVNELTDSKKGIKSICKNLKIYCIISIIIFVVACCFCFPRNLNVNLEIDYWGIIIGLIAIITTILVGSQILQVVDFEKKSDRYIKDLENKFALKQIEIEQVESKVKDYSEENKSIQKKIKEIYREIKNIQEEMEHVPRISDD